MRALAPGRALFGHKLLPGRGRVGGMFRQGRDSSPGWRPFLQSDCSKGEVCSPAPFFRLLMAAVSRAGSSVKPCTKRSRVPRVKMAILRPGCCF
jgi:hypothetical protein